MTVVSHWKVKYLYLNDNNFEDDSVEKFNKFLIPSDQSFDNLNLQVINMNNNHVTYPVAETFTRVIQEVFCKKYFLLCMDHVLLVQEGNGTNSIIPKCVFNHTFKSFYAINCNINLILRLENHFKNLEQVGICNNYSTTESQLNANDLVKKIRNQRNGASIVVVLQQVLIAVKTNSDILQHILNLTTSLRVMCFQCSKISYEIVMQIVRLLQITKHFDQLSLIGCDLGKNSCEILLQLLSVVNCKVVSLNLSSNHIESHTAIKTIVDISRHLKVNELCLKDNNLQDGGVKYFAELLQDNEHIIKAIDFRDNQTCNMTEGEFMHISNCNCSHYIYNHMLLTAQ